MGLGRTWSVLVTAALHCDYNSDYNSVTSAKYKAKDQAGQDKEEQDQVHIQARLKHIS